MMATSNSKWSTIGRSSKRRTMISIGTIDADQITRTGKMKASRIKMHTKLSQSYPKLLFKSYTK